MANPTWWPTADLDASSADAAIKGINDMVSAFAQRYTQPSVSPSPQTSQPSRLRDLLPSLTPWDQGTQKPPASPDTVDSGQAMAANPASSASLGTSTAEQPTSSTSQTRSFRDLLPSLTPWATSTEQPSTATSLAPSTGSARPTGASGMPQAMPTSGTVSDGQPQAMPSGVQTSSGSAVSDGGGIDNTSRGSFVRTAWPHMLQAAGGNRDAAEMMLAAAISENGDVGRGGDFIGNNFFGIKGTGPAGSVSSPTWEQTASGPVHITDNFAAYNTPVEGFGGFFDFLRNNSRYAGALQRYQQTGDASQLFRDVNAAGYATDPSWASKVENIRQTQVAPIVRGVPAPNAGARPIAPAAAPSAAAPTQPVADGAPDPLRDQLGTSGGGIVNYRQPLMSAMALSSQPYDPDQGPHEWRPEWGTPGLGVSERGPVGIREWRPGDPSFSPGVVPGGSLLYPIDQRYPGQQPYDSTNAEGIDRSNEPGARNRIYGVPPEPSPGPLPPGLNSQPKTQDALNRQMYRQPLAPTQGPDTATGADVPYDPRQYDQGAHETGYTVGGAAQNSANAPTGAPAADQLSSNGAAGPATITAGPASYGPSGDQPQTPAYTPPAPQQPSESPLKPLYDLAGRAIGYVHTAAEAAGQAASDAGSMLQNEGIVAPAGNAIANTVTRPLLGKPPLTAEEYAARGEPRSVAAIDQAVQQTARSLPANIDAATQAIGQGNYLQAGLSALGVVGDLAPSMLLARQLNGMLPTVDTPMGEIGAGDVVMAAALGHDAIRLGYGAIQGAGRIWAPIAQAIREGVPAERFSEWVSQQGNAAAGAIDQGIQGARSAWQQGRQVAAEANAADTGGGALSMVGPQAASGTAQPPAPPFFSQLQRTIEDKMPNRTSPGQVQGILNNSPVKPDEVAWTGLDDWLREQGGSVTKQQVLDFLDQNQVRVEEVTKGDTTRDTSGLNQARGAIEPAQAQLRNAEVGLTDALRASGGNIDEISSQWGHGGRDEAMRIAPDATTAYESAFQAHQDAVDRVATLERAIDEKPPNATRYGNYTLPGGQNYRELLLTLPEKGGPAPMSAADIAEYERLDRLDGYGRLDPADEARFRDLHQRMNSQINAASAGTSYRSPHWEEPNVLAHVRFNDRVAPDGAKVLNLEEVQSDWHQAGRKEGYQGTEKRYAVFDQSDRPIAHFSTPEEASAALRNGEVPGGLTHGIDRNTATGAVPNAPFAKTWPELAIKRMIRYAAENGYDRITWPPGQVHADRYSLAQHVDQLIYTTRDGATGTLEAFKGGHEVVTHDNVPANKLGDYVGQEVANRLMSGEPDIRAHGDVYQMDTRGLTMGGEGMKGFYDQILPSVAAKIGKKFGARVGTSELEIPSTWPKGGFKPGETQSVHSMDITPAMRESVMQQGQPLFAQAGPQAAGAADTLGQVNTAVSNYVRGSMTGGIEALLTDPGSPQGEDESDADYAARRTREIAQRAGTHALVGGAAFAGTGALMRRGGGGALQMVGPEGSRYDPRLAQEPVLPGLEPPRSAVPLPTAPGDAAAQAEMRSSRSSPLPGIPIPGATREPLAPPQTPSPAQVASASARGPALGQRLNQPITPEPSGVPLGPRVATATTDINAGARWAENVLYDTAGTPRPGVGSMERPSNQARQSWGSIADERVSRELAPAIQDAAAAGLQHELPQYLSDTLALDRLNEAYRSARQAALDALKTPEQAEAEGQRALMQAQRAVGKTVETAKADLLGQEQRVGDRMGTLQDAAQQVWDNSQQTLREARDAGTMSQDDLSHMEQWPHWTPATPIADMLPEGRSGPSFLNDVANAGKGEPVNPLVAARNATVAAQRINQQNTVAQTLIRAYDDAQALGGGVQPRVGGERQLFNGDTPLSTMIDGEKQTIMVPKQVADGLTAITGMGMRPESAPAWWRFLMHLQSGSLTAGRFSFLPKNLLRDHDSYMMNTMAIEGPQHTPAIFGEWMRQAGLAAADIMKAQVTARTPVAAALGFAAGATPGDENTPLSTRLLHGAEGALGATFLLGANKAIPTGQAAEFLARGGGVGGGSSSLAAGQRWLREQGGVPIRNVGDFANFMKDWGSDILSLQGAKAVNERQELIAKTAAMVRADQRGESPGSAMLRGKDVTYDPDVAGTMVRGMNNYVQFLGAMTQGAAQESRLWFGNGGKNFLPTLAATTLVTAPIVLAAEAWNRSDPQRAAAYDNVSQFAKDAGVVWMMPWAGSDIRGPLPQYVVVPTELSTPMVVGLRGMLEHVDRLIPGLSPNSGRSDYPANATEPEKWASVLNEALSVFHPLRGDSPGGVAAGMVPAFLREPVGQYLNKDLSGGGDITSQYANERATMLSQRLAQGAQAAGRAISTTPAKPLSDFLQNIQPANVEHLIRNTLPAYGDVATGASDLAAPGPFKRAEQGRAANIPFLGSPISAMVKDAGGANLERLQSQASTPTVQGVLRSAKLQPSDVDLTVPSAYKGATLTRSEQVRWQRAANIEVRSSINDARDDPKWDDPLSRKQAVLDTIAKAHERAAQDVLGLSETDIQDRIDRQRSMTRQLMATR